MTLYLTLKDGVDTTVDIDILQVCFYWFNQRPDKASLGKHHLMT